MKKTHLLSPMPLALLLLAVASDDVWAQGPTRRTVEITQAVAAPPDEVWAIIGNFQDMGWHPAVAETEGRGGNAPGATRTLTLSGGGQIQETLEKTDPEARSLVYRIEQVDPKVLPVTDYASTLSVAPAPAGGSILTWTGTFSRVDPSDDPPAALSDAAAVAAVSQVYQAGLANVKALAEAPGN